jgi:hypothetical protein
VEGPLGREELAIGFLRIYAKLCYLLFPFVIFVNYNKQLACHIMEWINKNSLILKKFNIITQNSFESVGGLRPEPGGEKRRECLKLDQTWKE